MPKSRRVSKKNKSLWAKIAGLFVVLFVAFWIFLPKQGNDVLGVSTTNLFGIGAKSTSSTSNTSTCKPMISAISLSNPCTISGRGIEGTSSQGQQGQQAQQPGFKTITYTCTDGTKGSSTKNCLSPQQALDTAGKTCSKNSQCKPPSQGGNSQGGTGLQTGQSQRQGPSQGGQQQGGQLPQDNSFSQ